MMIPGYEENDTGAKRGCGLHVGRHWICQIESRNGTNGLGLHLKNQKLYQRQKKHVLSLKNKQATDYSSLANKKVTKQASSSGRLVLDLPTLG